MYELPVLPPVHESEELREPPDLRGVSCGEIPVVELPARVGRAVTAKDFGLVVFGVERDAQEVRPVSQVGIVFERRVNLREVRAHQRALVGHGAARVDECDEERAAPELSDAYRLAVLID